MPGSMALADWRRRVADLYADVRRLGAGRESWTRWRSERDHLLASHPETPIPAARRQGFRGMRFFPYDPSWRLSARVEPREAGRIEVVDAAFTPVGTVVAERGDDEIRLPLLWLMGYGGGLFLPFRDATNGSGTYRGGRYLLDQAKGADLGVTPGGDLILDFNFAYHPSCAHDDRWTCPLAPPGSTIAGAVRAGELSPA